MTQHASHLEGFGRDAASDETSWLSPEAEPRRFAQGLVALGMRLAPAQAGALIRRGTGEVVLSVGDAGDAWIGRCLPRLEPPAEPGRTVAAEAPTDGPYYDARGVWCVLVALPADDAGARADAVFLLAPDAASVRDARERLPALAPLMDAYQRARAMRARAEAARAPVEALSVLAAVNEQDRAFAACVAACNEIESRFACERVSLGYERSGSIRLAAMGHTDKVVRKTTLARSIEAVMDEALDQDCEVLHPPPPDDIVVSRAAREHARAHGPVCVASLPLRRAGEVVGVLTVEREPARPFTPDDIESLRLICELLTPRLVELDEHDRWVGARAALRARRALAWAVGPSHTWTKVAAVLACAALAFVIFAKGPYRVSGPFTIEATTQQIVPAPYDGFLASAAVDVGDTVEPGDVLATLDAADLRLERSNLIAERRAALTEAAVAQRDGETAEAQIAQARADRAQARIDLLERRIEQSTIRAPIGGTVVEGDLDRMVGGPVATGDTLFTIAPVDALRAEVRAPEDQIADVEVGSTGKLATASFPERRIGFTVERIDPVARVVDGENVFALRVRLDRAEPWMRPGMEGVAKVDAGRRRYAWIWTREVVNWVRMKLWI